MTYLQPFCRFLLMFRQQAGLRLLCACLLICACGQSSAPDKAATEDSAGVSIIALRGEKDAPVVRLQEIHSYPKPSVEPGENEIFLYRVVSARRLNDDRVVVANRGTNQILVFSSDGRISALSREGRGPGEFRRLSGMLTNGDTIAALDGELRRISVMTATGHLLREYVIQPPNRAHRAGLAGAVGALDNGRLVIWLQTRLSRQDIVRLNEPHTVGQIPVVVFTVATDGTTTSVIGEFPGEELYQGTTRTPEGAEVPANWGPAPFGSWTGFGIHSNRVYVFRGADRDYRVYSSDGRLLAIYRGAWRIREVTAGARSRHIDEWVRRFHNWGTPAERRRKYELVAYPQTMPAYRSAVVGTDGNVWIEPYETWDGERRVYIGYDSTGRAVGKLIIDYEEGILEIGNGHAVLLHVAEDGVETVKHTILNSTT